MPLYADLIPAPVKVRISNYFLSFTRHIAIYRNATLVATVDLNQITWC
jgi:hypothetical protein